MDWVIIGSGNGLSSIRRQAIIWTNAALPSIWDPWQQIPVKFESHFYHFHSRKYIWKCRLSNRRPFCPGRGGGKYVLTGIISFFMMIGLAKLAILSPNTTVFWFSSVSVTFRYVEHDLGLISSELKKKVFYSWKIRFNLLRPLAGVLYQAKVRFGLNLNLDLITKSKVRT